MLIGNLRGCQAGRLWELNGYLSPPDPYFKNWVLKLHPLRPGPAHEAGPQSPSHQVAPPLYGPAPLSGRLGRAGLACRPPFPLPPAAGLGGAQRAPRRLASSAGRERTGKRGPELDWEPGKPRESGAPTGLGRGRGAQGLASGTPGRVSTWLLRSKGLQGPASFIPSLCLC